MREFFQSRSFLTTFNFILISNYLQSGSTFSTIFSSFLLHLGRRNTVGVVSVGKNILNERFKIKSMKVKSQNFLENSSLLFRITPKTKARTLRICEQKTVVKNRVCYLSRFKFIDKFLDRIKPY